MSDFIRMFLIFLNAMAWVTAMISWCRGAHHLYCKHDSVKRFAADMAILCALVCIGSICGSIALGEWMR